MNRVRGVAPALLSVGVLAATFSVDMSARAEVTKEQCVQADTKGQGLILDEKLVAARQQLVQCVDPVCPALVRQDCAQRLGDLDRMQPAIIFEVHDSSGASVTGATVSVDGSPPAAIDGTALPVDPGAHVFTLSFAGHAAMTRRLTIAQGETGRREPILLEESRPPASPEGAADGSTRHARRTTWALVTAGAGVAAIAAGSVFGVLAFAAAGRQNSECATASNCPDRDRALSDHATVATDSTISTVAFVAGAALVAGGVALWLTAPARGGVSQRAGTLRFASTLGPGVAACTLVGSF